MADSNVEITAGTGTNIDTRTEAGGDHRQVIVLGDPSVTDSVAEVRATDPDSNSEGIVVRDVNTSAIVSRLASTLTIKTDPGYELGSIKGINSTVAIYFDRGEPTVIAKAGTGTFTVKFDPGYELGSVKSINSTVAVYFDQSNPSVNVGTPSVNDLSGTAILPQVLSGSFTGSYPSGYTIKAPIASRVIKVYAYSLTTTAQASSVVKFGDGGAAGTTFTETALYAPSQGISGSNQQVTPPGYLFATASGSTLAIKCDETTSLIHYTVSYFLESA
ncbi:hypothetical protein M0R04_10970 [Candidatus Dojkabacteria bacterium]|jgi:hypothetical protein|nr:hypothetical protein [Candidatus Dojkabacteria bacterium]